MDSTCTYMYLPGTALPPESSIQCRQPRLWFLVWLCSIGQELSHQVPRIRVAHLSQHHTYHVVIVEKKIHTLPDIPNLTNFYSQDTHIPLPSGYPPPTQEVFNPLEHFSSFPHQTSRPMPSLSRAAIKAIKQAHINRLTSFFQNNRQRPGNIINPELCEKALDKLDLSSYDKNPIIVDMNPGSSVWSAALNKRLNPRSHILLEPEVKYKPIMKEFTASHPGSYWLPLDGYDWNTYSKLFASGLPWPVEHDFLPLDPIFVPPEDGMNTDIIFTANLSMAGSDGDRLLAQFLACCALGQWVQKFGRVRFLVWVQDALRDRYLPRGVGGRNRAAVMAETVADVQEVVVSKALRTGKGHPRSFQLDEEGNLASHQKRRFKSPKGITVGLLKKRKSRMSKIQPMTVTELEAALANIEGSRNSKKGRGKVKIERVEARHTKLDSLDIERMRKRLLHVVEYPDDEEVDNLFEKFVETDIYITERTNLFMERITKFLEDPETDQRWLTEMANPPWWYRRNKKRLITLAGELARGPSKSFLTAKSHITPIDIETTRQIEALEGLEESEPTDPAALQQQKTFDKFQERWVKTPEGTAAKYGVEDEALVFKKGMLMWGRRKFEPVVTENSDFHPPEPLALLDFSPIVLGEFFQPEDQKLRGSNWEVYMWILRSLFMLRAHSLNSALMSMTPGGEHLLHMVDQSAAIDGNMRVRTLDVGQLVELTKAWRKWPFQAEGEHLEPPIAGRIRGVKKGEDR